MRTPLVAYAPAWTDALALLAGALSIAFGYIAAAMLGLAAVLVLVSRARNKRAKHMDLIRFAL